MSIGTVIESGLAVSSAIALGDLVSYQQGAIVSRVLIKRSGGNVTLFAFAQGQALSEHTAPFAALAQILEGEAELVIGGHPVVARAGQTVLMPASVPHSVNATTAFKMLLTMVRDLPSGGNRVGAA